MADIERDLPAWLPDADIHGPVVVSSERRRRTSLIVRLRVGDPVRYRLFVKATPRRPPSAGARGDRPRLVPVADPRLRATLELRALRAVEARLGPTGTDRFDVLHPLGVVDDGMAVVMLTHEGTSLARALSRVSRGPRTNVAPEALMESAGAWLRLFHDAPPDLELPVRQAHAADIATALRAFGDFLLAGGSDPALGGLVDRAVAAVADLEDPLPIRRTHGDFAPRNLIVGPDGRLTAIDLLGHWRAPIYEDLATFLVALHSGRQMALTGGRLLRRPLAVLEERFLGGYAGSGDLPRRPIAIYESLLVLDKWSSRIARLEGAGPLRRFERHLLGRHFLGRTRAALDRIEAS